MRGSIGIVALGALLAGCQQKDVAADGAWVRLPAVAGNPGAAYLTLRGGSAPTTLIGVGAPFAVRAELHESMKGHAGMTAMAPAGDIAVPAGATVRFEPGGRHVMLFDIAPALQPGARAPLTLRFADGKKLEVEAIVVGPGDPEPTTRQ